MPWDHELHELQRAARVQNRRARQSPAANLITRQAPRACLFAGSSIRADSRTPRGAVCDTSPSQSTPLSARTSCTAVRAKKIMQLLQIALMAPIAFDAIQLMKFMNMNHLRSKKVAVSSSRSSAAPTCNKRLSSLNPDLAKDPVLNNIGMLSEHPATLYIVVPSDTPGCNSRE